MIFFTRDKARAKEHRLRSGPMIRIYDPDPIRIAWSSVIFLPEVCLSPRINPCNFGDDPDFDTHPGSRLQSLISAEVCRF